MELPKKPRISRKLALEALESNIPSYLHNYVKKKKPKAGLVEFFFKGLPEDLRFSSHTIPQSLDMAKGTLYETWFNALKLSSFYIKICEEKTFPSDASKRTYELFGDLRNISFDQWWVETGYGLFAEKRPFNKIEIADSANDFGEGVKVLKIEIPLDVSPKTLRNQFENLLELHHPHYKDFDRWKTSTAEARFKNRKLTSASLDLCLDIYKKYLANQNDLSLYELGVKEKINPKLVVLPSDRPKIAADKQVKMASAVSEYIEKAKNLVAYATEGIFPCVENHHWIERKARKPKYDDE